MAGIKVTHLHSDITFQEERESRVIIFVAAVRWRNVHILFLKLLFLLICPGVLDIGKAYLEKVEYIWTQQCCK